MGASAGVGGADEAVAGSGPFPWFVLQHVEYEGPASIATGLDERGVEVRVVRLDAGDAVPEAGELAGLVVMGGPMSVGDQSDHPWLVPERALLRDAVRRGLPVLGVCLGAQQLAAALGADVRPGPSQEIGTGRVVLTADGRRDRVFGPEYGGLRGGEIPCFHWHGDTFGLPSGAVHLAATAAYPHQAFRVGELAYGLQFHIEVDDRLAEGWRTALPPGTSLSEGDISEVETVGRRLLGRFVDLAIRQPDALRSAP